MLAMAQTRSEANWTGLPRPVLSWLPRAGDRPAPRHTLHTEAAVSSSEDAQQDLRLMAAVAGGDEDALRRLMERHLGRVVGLAQRILGTPDGADDVAQEVFTRVWRNAHAFDSSGQRARFTTWLYKITFNLCLDRRRRHRGEWVAIDHELPDAAPGPGQQEERRQTRLLLAQGMARLSERHRAALVLHYIDELTAREAAAVMGLGEKAFESLVLRARRSLREYLESTLGGERA